MLTFGPAGAGGETSRATPAATVTRNSVFLPDTRLFSRMSPGTETPLSGAASPARTANRRLHRHAAVAVTLTVAASATIVIVIVAVGPGPGGRRLNPTR